LLPETKAGGWFSSSGLKGYPSRYDPPANGQKKGCEYKFYNEFQSHEPEFDYLKSLEIEEKINKIKWCRRQNAAHFLLSTNGTSSPNGTPKG
jgi:hypothetical protein